MKKFMAIICFMGAPQFVQAQYVHEQDLLLSSQITIAGSDGAMKEQRFQQISIQNQNKNVVAVITINRIKQKVNVTITDTSESDTLTTEEDGGIVDTEFPIPNTEYEKDILENLVEFVNNPVVLNLNSEGIFETKTKKKKGLVNVANLSISGVPILNQNPFLSTSILDFGSDNSIVTDTVLSQIHSGFFITKYTKNNSGYDFEGSLLPIQKKTKEANEDPYIANENYDRYIYKGSITLKKKYITQLIAEVDLKKTVTISSIKYNKIHEEKYKISIENTLN